MKDTETTRAHRPDHQVAGLLGNCAEPGTPKPPAPEGCCRKGSRHLARQAPSGVPFLWVRGMILRKSAESEEAKGNGQDFDAP
mgnify:CR=1 FL=1